VSDKKVKVLYIAGYGRSGSTLLANILGEIEGFVAVGEIHRIWQYGLIQNKLCGCGTPVKECRMWSTVLDEAFGGVDHSLDPHEMIRLRGNWARTKHVPLMLTSSGRNLVKRRLAKYLSKLERLYWAVQTTTGSRVIVDTSKLPSFSFVSGMIPSVDLYVMHLVRDSRAVAYSWRRKRLQPNSQAPEYMSQHNSIVSSLRWVARNLATEALWRRFPERYARLRYEDFVVNPGEAIAQVLALVGEETVWCPDVVKHEVELGVNHNIWGNPNRFRRGTVKIHPDNEWAFHAKPNATRLCTLLSFPLLVRYRYF
jgi:hypothetical protein